MKTRKLSVQHYRRHDTHNEHKRRLKSFIFSRLKRNSLKILIHNFLSRIFSSLHLAISLLELVYCYDSKKIEFRPHVWIWESSSLEYVCCGTKMEKKRKMNENKFLYNQKDSIVPCLRTSVVYVGWKTEISELYVERTKNEKKLN